MLLPSGDQAKLPTVNAPDVSGRVAFVHKPFAAPELASRIERLNILIDSDAALRAVEERGQPFDVFLKIDCGYHRAGVSPDNPDSVALARAMLQSKVIRFQGVLTHAGHSYHARNVDDVRRIAAEESAPTKKR